MASTLEILLRRQQPANATGNELAGALRRQNQIGQVMELSGHSDFAPMGARLSGQAMQMAAVELRRRQAEAQAEKEALRYQENQAHRDRMFKLALGREARQVDSNRRANERADQMLDIRQDENLYRHARNLSDRMMKTRTPELISAAEQSVEMMYRFAKEQRVTDPSGEGVDLPGIGVVEGRLPQFMQSREGKTFRSSVSKLVNVIANTYFGASQTEGELKRLNQEMLHILDGGKDEDMFIVLPKLLNQLRLVRDELERPYVGTGALEYMYPERFQNQTQGGEKKGIPTWGFIEDDDEEGIDVSEDFQ